MSPALSTSHSTRTFSPPRIGSWQENTGWSTQSLLSPVACSVDEPSKPQIGRSLPSCMILVFERSSGVGDTPSSQMYSAWYATHVPFRGGSTPRERVIDDGAQAVIGGFLDGCSDVNAL